MDGSRRGSLQPSRALLRTLRDVTLLAIVTGFAIAYLLQAR